VKIRIFRAHDWPSSVTG